MPEATVDTAAETAATAAAPPSNGTLFHRRIESVPAKRQFAGFSNGGGGFRLETLNPATSDPFRHGGSGEGIGPAATVGKKYCVAESMELALDPELSFGFTMRRIGAGLENLGNTCFLNSVLQCLTYTEPLAAYLQSGWHKSSCRKAGFCALCAIQNHVNRALQSTGRSLAPKDLVLNLRCISRNFRNARQEDAHEYMVNLLESMHKCCLPSGVPSESPSAFERSLVHKIFGGRLRSQVKCMQCAFCSDKFDPFLDLSLEIDKADSLQKALAHFTAKEYLDGGAREYQCQRCKQKVKALKQLSIQKAPYVLNVHLKRFDYHQPGEKIDKKVHFGSTLDLKPFVTGAYDGDLKYTLYGVLVHYGENTHSGHYSCFVRTSSGMWYSLDDHRVCNVSEKRVLEEKAYMLFYVRGRKNFIPKKPVDVVHAKNMIINAMENRMQSDSNQVCKKIFQNGPTDKITESSCPSFALPQVDVAFAGSIKETLIKEKSIQGTVQETMVESSLLEKEVQLNMSSVMPVVKDDVKYLSSSGDCSTQSTVANGSGGCLNNPEFVATNNVINETNKERSANENPTELVVAAPNSNCLQNLIDKNYPSVMPKILRNNEEKAEKDMINSLAVNPVRNGIDSSSIASHIKVSIPLKEGADKKSKMVNSSSQVEEPEHENIQNGCLSKESSNGDCAKDMEIEPFRLSGLESATTTTLAKNSVGHNCQRKLKKKFSKRQITMTRLSSSIILGAVFSFRKKKHKKVKRSVPKIDILAEENLGPSTSEVTRPQAIKVNSRRKGLKLSSSKSEDISTTKNGNGSNGNLLEGVKYEKLRDRVGDNDAAVATDKPAQCVSSSALARNSSFGREGDTLKVSRRDSVQNGMMNLLTRGLQETIVARWDEMEHPSSLITERSGREPFSIGYIGDDCDEEYDKGKRKKVKTSIRDFGGPNPFQEIATKKAKLKNPKPDRSSSANQPFRI